MGIDDLTQTIKKRNCKQTISLDYLDGWRIAVDISIYLYKYVKSVEKWEDRVIELVMELRKRFIKPVFIFDGQNVSDEKKKERVKRKIAADKQKEKYNFLEKLDARGNPEETYKILKEKFPKTDIPQGTFALRKFIEKKKISMKLQIKAVDESIISKTKEILTVLGMAFIQTDEEAETVCVGLCRSGKVDAVLTNDTDVLAYTTDDFNLCMLTDLDLRTLDLTFVFKNDVLQEFEMSELEFRDFCILLGCDYNEHKRIHCFGPKNAGEYILKYKNIETMIAEGIITPENIEKTNYERCRELFSSSKLDNILIPMNKSIDEDVLAQFLESIGSRYQVHQIMEYWVLRSDIFGELN